MTDAALVKHFWARYKALKLPNGCVPVQQFILCEKTTDPPRCGILHLTHGSHPGCSPSPEQT